MAEEGEPEEVEGDVGVVGDVVSFAALVVGKEDEAVVGVNVFEEDGADIGGAFGSNGSYVHGVGLGEVGVDGFLEPEGELLEWVVVEVG